jgi:predicted nucleotidyltransferase
MFEMILRGQNGPGVHLCLDVWVLSIIERSVNLYPERQPVLEISELDIVMVRIREQTIRQRLGHVGVVAKVISLVEPDALQCEP